MEIKGKIHCLFEQSGTFRDELRSMGYEAYDYDIQNEYGKTDVFCDLFAEIDAAFDGRPSLFDSFTKDDLLFAFFPCIHFCQFAVMYYRIESYNLFSRTPVENAQFSIDKFNECAKFFTLLKKLEAVVNDRGLRMILENPWSFTLLWMLMRKPELVDKNRRMMGDSYVKPTAWWFFNCSPTGGIYYEKPRILKTMEGSKSSDKKGICSAERSEITPAYARNFIKSFVLSQNNPQLELFEI